MRRGGGRIFIILGLILALIAGGGIFFVLANAQPAPTQEARVPVVVAVQSIPSRSEVSADRLQSVGWPVSVPTPIGAFADSTDVIGRLTLVQIFPGQPIIEQMLITKELAQERHSNAALILEKGSVAIAMGVSINSDVAEAIQPGDRVDLLVTYIVEGQSAQTTGGQYIVTQKTLENVLILQVGPWPRDVGEQSSTQGGGSINVVTVQLTEQDALALEHIENTSGAYTFVLRAANDADIFTTEPVTLEYLNKRFNFNIPGLGQ